MEAQAPYSLSATPPVADLRELVAPVAAWLAALGFQHIECGPVGGVEESEIMAGWESPTGTLFHLMLVAQPGVARCRFFEQVGNHSRVLCDWLLVQQVSEVQLVVAQSCRFQQARLASGSGLASREASLPAAILHPLSPSPPAAPAPVAAPVAPLAPGE
jgi:hypothetical protein